MVMALKLDLDWALIDNHDRALQTMLMKYGVNSLDFATHLHQTPLSTRWKVAK